MIGLTMDIIGSDEFKETKPKKSTPNKKRYEREFILNCLSVYYSGKYKTVRDCASYFSIEEGTFRSWIKRFNAK